MSTANYVLSQTTIPDGYQIYEERLEVSGVSFRKNEARPFVKSGSTSIYLERETDNPHDRNAIAIYGKAKKLFGVKNYHLGFVPKEIAKKVVENGFGEQVIARLYKTYLGSDGFIEIEFQLLGPKGQYYDYAPPITENAESYVDHVPRIKQLKQNGEYDEAVTLLLQCVDWTEKESKQTGFGVAPWYYQQLAIIYRKQKDRNAEIEILERFMEQTHARGTTPAKLIERLEKLNV